MKRQWHTLGCTAPQLLLLPVAQAVLAANAPGGLETVVVRPHRLWGAGDTVILAALLGACRAGAWR